MVLGYRTQGIAHARQPVYTEEMVQSVKYEDLIQIPVTNVKDALQLIPVLPGLPGQGQIGLLSSVTFSESLCPQK